VVLVVPAGLLIRTFMRLAVASPGFDPNHLVIASASLEDARHVTTPPVAQSVAQRRREMGIRLALGATVQGVIRTAAIPGITLSSRGLLAVQCSRYSPRDY
jgi:hypothetical protein